MFMNNTSQPEYLQKLHRILRQKKSRHGLNFEQYWHHQNHLVALHLPLHKGTNSSPAGPWGTGSLSLIEPEHCTTAIQQHTTNIQLVSWSTVKSKIDRV